MAPMTLIRGQIILKTRLVQYLAHSKPTIKQVFSGDFGTIDKTTEFENGKGLVTSSLCEKTTD